MFWYLSQKKLEVLVGVKLVRFGGFDQTVQDCAGFGTIIGFDDHEVLATDGERPDGLLGVVIVHWNVSVIKELPEILLLDEATSALDSGTEKRLLQNLRSMTNKTVIIVTHRPAALEICDRVIDFTNAEK